MAKRYFTHERLEGVEGHFKPQGTMGRHDMFVTRHGGELTVVGSVSGWAVVQPGDTLGYDRGVVWLLPRPEQFKDPIRRVLAEAHLSQRLLEVTSQDVTENFSYFESVESHAYEVATALGGKKVWGGEDWVIRGGDAVVIRTEACNTLGYRGGVSRVVVRPTADKEKVAAWLKELWRLE